MCCQFWDISISKKAANLPHPPYVHIIVTHRFSAQWVQPFPYMEKWCVRAHVHMHSAHGWFKTHSYSAPKHATNLSAISPTVTGLQKTNFLWRLSRGTRHLLLLPLTWTGIDLIHGKRDGTTQQRKPLVNTLGCMVQECTFLNRVLGRDGLGRP